MILHLSISKRCFSRFIKVTEVTEDPASFDQISYSRAVYATLMLIGAATSGSTVVAFQLTHCGGYLRYPFFNK
jgi:hypothetical protein